MIAGCFSEIRADSAVFCRKRGTYKTLDFMPIYLRVLGTLGRDKPIAVLLVLANMLVAGLQFVDPLLFVLAGTN